jgi:hypothetical protein
MDARATGKRTPLSPLREYHQGIYQCRCGIPWDENTTCDICRQSITITHEINLAKALRFKKLPETPAWEHRNGNDPAKAKDK